MIDSDRKQTQDQGALSHKEGIVEYAPTFFFNFDILQKHFEL